MIKNSNNENSKKSKIVTITYGLLVVLILSLASYALFDYSFLGSGNTISLDEMEIEFLESSNEVIGLTNAIPLSDDEGRNQPDTFDFQVKTKTGNDIGISYNLVIEKLEALDGYTLLNDNQVKVYLTDYDGNVVVPPTLVSDLSNYVLYTKTNLHNTSNYEYRDKYKLRIWIDNSVTGEGWTESTKLQYNFKIGVESNQKAKTSNLSDSVVTLSNSNYIYDGSAKVPSITVKYDDKTLTKDTDYTVSYANNTNAGVATVTVTGKGNYTGTIIKKFIIEKAESVCSITSVSSMSYPKTSSGNVVYSCTGDGSVSAVSSDTSFMTVGSVSSTNIPVTILKEGTGAINIEQAEGTNYKKSKKVTKEISVDLSSYTVNVSVQNGTVDTSSKNVVYGENGVFAIASNNGYGAPTVSCTNSQSAVIESDNLKVNNVTKDTTCTVTYKKNPVVNVVVQNGIVEDLPSREVVYGNSTDFNIINNEGTDYTSVTCTNSQTGVVNDNVLKVSNVTQDTTCTVVYTERTYTITYASGSDSTATGLPSSQTKRYSKSVTLSDVEPTSETNEFLGWSSLENAPAEENVWHDPSSEYNYNRDVTLYAQWYDVDTLETEYTGFSRSGDFVSKSRSVAPGKMSAWTYNEDFTAVSATSGYKGLGVVSFVSSTSAINFYGMRDIASNSTYAINSRNAYTGAVTPTYTLYRLELLQRTGAVTSGTVDSRILNMQNVKQACLSISSNDVYVRSITTGDFSVSAKSAGSKTVSSTLDGYTLMGNVGFDLSNGASSGANISVVYLYGVTDNGFYVRNPYSSAAKVAGTLHQLFIRNKSVGTATTPSYGDYPTRGQKRLSALNLLKNATSDYFDYNDVNVSEISKTGVSTTSTTTQYFWSTAVTSRRRIVGVVGYLAWNNGGSGDSYAATKTAILSTVNSESANVSGKFGRTYRQSNTTSYYSTGITHTIFYLYIE